MPQSDADRIAAGKRRVVLWLHVETVQRLDEICAESGYTRPEQVASMIDGEYEEWRGRNPNCDTVRGPCACGAWH